ncbi:TonB-dependent receptor plug domain-containing protein [Ohtaekwangia sp.]|uniref:TonB-dependent receptor plug domain-containing protein n=1 Tax=Ohtaekwangia sp. TaxID=2066019 RepID=UPI002F9307BD
MARYLTTLRSLRIAGLLMLSVTAFAQEADHTSDLYKFTVDQDILNLKFEGNAAVKLRSASGYDEDVTRTPYAASVLTREEIENSGALTIPEALRLVPGLFVQQTTNGLYEVYIQGREALPAGETLSDARSKMVLVMINNTPVNNMFDGGVLWEALPVSIQDVDRIEVLQNPATVFLGRDAAAGVINIITKIPEGTKLNIQGTSQRSFTPSGAQTSISHASVGLGVRDKFSMRLSGSFNSARRFQDTDYVYSAGRYIPADSLLFYQSSVERTNQYGTLARQDYAITSFMRYTPQEKITLDASLSTQHSQAQTIYGGFEELALTRRISSLNLVNVNGVIYNIHTQLSYQFGTQNMAAGYPGYKADVQRINARVFYDFGRKNFHIMPGVSYQRNALDDTPYQSSDSRYPDVINGNKSFYNYGIFLKAAATFFDDKLTIDGGVRRDYWDTHGKSVINYQGAVAYSPIDKILFHVVYATGTQGNTASELFDAGTRINPDGTTWARMVNPLLTGTQVHNLTAGARAKATDKISVGVNYFNTIYTGLRTEKSFTDSTGMPTREYINTDTDLKRSGVTTTISADFSSKLRMRAFATWQKTTFSKDTAAVKTNYTPAFTGGMTATFRTLVDKLTIGASVYLYGKYTMKTDRGAEAVVSKVVPDIKVSYKFWQENAVFINARNFANASSKEYIYSDRVPALYLVGVNLNF